MITGQFTTARVGSYRGRRPGQRHVCPADRLAIGVIPSVAITAWGIGSDSPV